MKFTARMRKNDEKTKASRSANFIGSMQIGFQEIGDEGLKVETISRSPLFLAETIKQIVSINADDYPLHANP